MASLQARLRRLENERRFWRWLHFQRFLEGLTATELETYVRHGRWPEPLPELLPKGESRLDRLDRLLDMPTLGRDTHKVYDQMNPMHMQQSVSEFFLENLVRSSPQIVPEQP